MNILFVSDDVYARHLVVAIKSIINHNEKGISFYIFDLGIKDENKRNINDIVSSYGSEVNFIAVNEKEFESFPVQISYISLATYARLKAAEYLPDN
ncbi:TPA: glycosyltransferase family 8 protein, partial [Pasteurella multocida]|nr:glycosyltransferase family 8 protein [Pasteurella multocida]HDR1785054.1 glycosyltransferase family 8 protein [Pasteurella multocida]